MNNRMVGCHKVPQKGEKRNRSKGNHQIKARVFPAQCPNQEEGNVDQGNPGNWIPEKSTDHIGIHHGDRDMIIASGMVGNPKQDLLISVCHDILIGQQICQNPLARPHEDVADAPDSGKLHYLYQAFLCGCQAFFCVSAFTGGAFQQEIEDQRYADGRHRIR